MVYVGKIQVLPEKGRGGPYFGSTYRVICYHNNAGILRQKLIDYRKLPLNKPQNVWGKAKRWGKIRIECWEEGQEIRFPYEVTEVLIIK